MKLAYKLSPYIREKKHSYLSCNSTVRMQGQWKVLCYPVLWDGEMLQPGFFLLISPLTPQNTQGSLLSFYLKLPRETISSSRSLLQSECLCPVPTHLTQHSGM